VRSLVRRPLAQLTRGARHPARREAAVPAHPRAAAMAYSRLHLAILTARCAPARRPLPPLPLLPLPLLRSIAVGFEVLLVPGRHIAGM